MDIDGALENKLTLTADISTHTPVIDADLKLAVRGEAGRDGRDGIDGKDGVDGKNGVDGKDGANGATGDPGKAATIKIGTVKTGETAAVVNSGTDSDAVFDIVLPTKGIKGDTGATGAQGEKGEKGDKGDPGTDGLRGEQGPRGSQGDPGPIGPQGIQGKSAYEVAVGHGYSGNEQQWLATLKGDAGPQGPQGATGIQGLQGVVGPQGPQGIQGSAGPKGDTGDRGPAGDRGADGLSAYEIAKEKGFSGTQQEWITSLKGEKGADGEKGEKGDAGPVGPQGPQGIPGEKGQDGVIGKDGTPGVSATVKVGKVTTGDAIAVVNSGTDNNAVLNFVLPAPGQAINIKGDKGDPGPKGDKGDKGDTGIADIETKNVAKTIAASAWTESNSRYSATIDFSSENLTDNDIISLIDVDSIDDMTASGNVITVTTLSKPTADLTLNFSIVYAKASTSGTGTAGKDGKSAYEIAVTNGFAGTESEWLKSLVGPAGTDGKNGKDGINGAIGPKGDPGDPGTAGKDGNPGMSAYEIAVKNGYTGTESEWLKSLIGSAGKDGNPGPAGVKGDTGDVGPAGPTGAKGDTGVKGDTGANGKDADMSLVYSKTEIDTKIGDIESALKAIVGGAA